MVAIKFIKCPRCNIRVYGWNDDEVLERYGRHYCKQTKLEKELVKILEGADDL